jgi:hypothetical protein
MGENELDSRWREICEKLMNEQDPEQFAILTNELFLLLEQREGQLRAMKHPGEESRLNQ